MMLPPYSYSQINVENGMRNPSTIHAQNTALSAYFRRYLFNEIYGLYDITLPKSWPENYFFYTLLYLGYISVFNTDKYGVICQHCTLSGYDVFYQPSHAYVSNPLINQDLELRINRDCTVIKLFPDYGSLYDLVSYYANKMAIICEGIDINILNTKLAFVFGTDEKSSAQTFKKAYDKLSQEPIVVTGKELFNEDGSPRWTMWTQNLKQNYIAGEMLEDLRKIKFMFDTDIGIPNANTDKKERLITSEVESNNIETRVKSELILDTIREGMKKTNEIFGTNLTIKMKFAGGGVNEPGSQTVNTGIVPMG